MCFWILFCEEKQLEIKKIRINIVFLYDEKNNTLSLKTMWLKWERSELFVIQNHLK